MTGNGEGKMQEMFRAGFKLLLGTGKMVVSFQTPGPKLVFRNSWDTAVPSWLLW